MAPKAAQSAALKKHCCPNPRPVVHREMLNIKNRSLCHGLPSSAHIAQALFYAFILHNLQKNVNIKRPFQLCFSQKSKRSFSLFRIKSESSSGARMASARRAHMGGRTACAPAFGPLRGRRSFWGFGYDACYEQVFSRVHNK